MKQKRAIVYIDGFNLYYGIVALKTPALKWLDIGRLARDIVEPYPQVGLERVKYFTAMVLSDVAKLQRQKIFHSALAIASKSGGVQLEIIQGKFLKRLARCSKCNSPAWCGKCNSRYKYPVEKMTDVNIACEMLEDAYEDRADVAFLISGDSDLVAVVEKVRTLDKEVVIVSPPKRVNYDLRKRASGGVKLSQARLTRCVLPHEVGKGISRPGEWV